MSKYTIKLEQLLSSDYFGDVAVTIQYDSQGPKIISVSGDDLSEDMLDQAQHFLNIFNFCLTKGIPALETSEQLIPKSDTELSRFLSFILGEVALAPIRFQDLKDEEIIPIDTEVLKDLM
jgi:hypothetical protein